MPTASPELRARWRDDSCAFDQLKIGKHFEIARGGVISPINGHAPSEDDLSAIDYLVHEWDYGYQADPPLHKDHPNG